MSGIWTYSKVLHKGTNMLSVLANIQPENVKKRKTKMQNVSTVAKGIQPTVGDVLWPKNYKNSRTKKYERETS